MHRVITNFCLLNRFYKILRITGLTIVGLIALVVILVNLTPVQNFLARKATDILSNKLKTKVTVKHIRIDFLNHVTIQGLYIEDKAHDTLLYAGEAQMRITDWFIFKRKPVLHYIGLHNAYVHLYRNTQSDVWNYQFIADAFQPKGKKDTTQTKKQFELDLKKIDLQNVRFHMDDAWGGEDMNYDIGSFQVDAKNFDFKKKVIDINSIAIGNTSVILKEYDAAHPHDTTYLVQTVDTTAFNPNKWAVHLSNLTLKDCIFHLNSNDTPSTPNEFDPAHIYVNNININASHINIIGDTIHGNIDLLTAKDRCGLEIKKMKAKVTVSPIASICENLELETNHSQLHNYYAMHYTHFPDFTSYITNVVMDVHLQNSIVDERDVAYFAPVLRQWPTVLHVSGNAKGTVANLTGKNLNITDGTTVIKGNVTMKGLPDIYKTYINYENGELLTTGNGILHYAPSLKSNPNISISSIKYAYFKGNYTGYLENFAVNGVLNTNLGSVTSTVKMNLKGLSNNKSIYSGKLVTNKFDIGSLLNQPDIGYIAFDADVNGISFDPEHAQVKINATVDRFDYKNYSYQHIYAEGLLAKRQFKGTLLVEDPNLALSFYGNLDYSQKLVKVNATAHILQSNFKNLNLTKDTVTAVADFDLNCTGSNIDNFLGYAKLYNIDINRNQHKLNVDSVYINSETTPTGKQLTIQSNDITASINGKYQLSKLPASIQYFLSGYLPNYIKPPSKVAPEQDLTFNVTTRQINNLLEVAFKNIHGFDNATIKGSLNTSQQNLTLHAKVPYAGISKVQMNNISINGSGNFNVLQMNTSIDNVSVNDSMLNGSLGVTTTLGSDSLNFNIATVSPDANSSVTLNGKAYARNDTFYLTMLPSEFYLSQTRWNIPGGSKVIYSNKYLVVNNLILESGLQKITANTELEKNGQSLDVYTENLDLGQLGSWAGFAPYQPDGRLNGSIKVKKIFGDLYVAADIRATDVKLGTDTIGNINITGDYDKRKKMVSLDPSTGIYKDGSSLIVSGYMSFDSTDNQKLDGKISFNNAPVSWASPFVSDVMSHLNGTLNGDINVGGTSDNPDINGNVALKDGGLKLDFLGTNYTIPSANIHMTSRRIDFGDVTLYDVYKNTATLSGYFSHHNFRDMRMRLSIRTPKFQVMDLHSYENQYFYGNLVCGVDSAIIGGPFDNIFIRIVNAVPAAKSNIYIPYGNTNDVGTYSYVSFKTYGKNQVEVKKAGGSKINIYLDANLNNLAQLTLILDPTTGDAITARGDGHIQLQIPSNNDIRIYGPFNIDQGDYTFTFKQLLTFRRKFILNAGSSILFKGPINQTDLNVDATYTVHTRLYDLLSDAEKAPGYIPTSELTDSKIAQDVNIRLFMNGTLNDPKLSFKLELPDKHSVGTYAYTKLERINQDDRQLFDQVAALLIINDFIPPEGLGSGTAVSGAINNVSQMLSSTASSQLTNIVNRILGNKDLSIDLKYTNYNLSDPTVSGGINRNQLSVGVRKNYLDDRLIVEVGSVSDWGRPTSTSSTSNFNIAGDFRVQYLLTPSGALRLNGFRTSDYDVTLDRDISRSGIGISWRKTFDGLDDFIRGNKYANKKAAAEKAQNENESKADSTTTKQ